MSRLLSESEVREFQELIDGYTPNHEVIEQFKTSNFAVIAGPAGAGKDTLRNGLIQRWSMSYVPILSTTTRPMRPGEAEGVDYHFREVEEIKQGLLDRIYFQAALVHNQQVSCLHVDEVRKLEPGQWGMSILIPRTERELRKVKPDLKTVFIVPPSLAALKDRINASRMLEPAEIDRRLQAAKNEITTALEEDDYYCVVSDTTTGVENIVDAYLMEEDRKDAVDAAAREVMQQILRDLLT